MFEPIRGGTRGGQAEFKWSDVSADKDRENYLGHSINAPTGRWQKNKDVHWYVRDETETAEERREELRKIKETEAEALSAVLGFGPSKPVIPGTSTSTGASGPNSIPVPVRDKPEKPADREEEKGERRLQKAERKARKEERRMRRAERAERRARRGHKNRNGDEDRSRSRSRDRSSRSQSPRRRDRDGEREREHRPRRPRSRSRTPPGRGDYNQRERERDRRRWDDSPRRR